LIFTDTLKLRPLHNWITINNPETSVWEVGQPSKSIFIAAYKGKLAIITDSSSNHSNNLNDYFYITIPDQFALCGEGILSFYHKFDTDTLTDGGTIEVSHDNGITWMNVLNDNVGMNKEFIGLYNDTIKGGNYGYSGNSNGWQYVEIYWLWLMMTKQTFNYYPIVRFRFVSDNINTNKNGWMIDNIIFRGYSITGAVNGSPIEQIKAFPNPSNGMFKFTIPENFPANAEFELYDILGRFVFTKKLVNNQIDIRNLDSGIYTFKINSDHKIVSIGKLVKQ
jgi:hypothetical protein